MNFLSKRQIELIAESCDVEVDPRIYLLCKRVQTLYEAQSQRVTIEQEDYQITLNFDED